MCKKKKKIERQKDLDIYQFTLIKRVEELDKLYLNVILDNKKNSKHLLYCPEPAQLITAVTFQM